MQKDSFPFIFYYSHSDVSEWAHC